MTVSGEVSDVAGGEEDAGLGVLLTGPDPIPDSVPLVNELLIGVSVLTKRKSAPTALTS